MWNPHGSIEDSLSKINRHITIAESLESQTISIPKQWPGSRKQLIAITLTIIYEESRFSEKIHSGELRGDPLSPTGKAICMGQLHQNSKLPYNEWITLAGTNKEATDKCIGYTAAFLIIHYKRCNGNTIVSDNTIARTFRGYATGSVCEPKGRDLYRVTVYNKILRKLLEK